MTIQFLEETAATAYGVAQKSEDDGNTSTDLPVLGPASLARPRLLVAGFLLATALTAGGAAGTMLVGPYLGRRRFESVTENGTAEAECDPDLVRQVREIFEHGASEFFEDGMHSNFSRALLATLTQHGRSAFQAIAEYLLSDHAKPDVVSESLRWLADFNDPATLRDRWFVLQRTLRDRSPSVRDGAILGFAALDDPRARPLLREAQGLENIDELRRLLGQVIEQLDATANAPTTTHGPAEPMA